MGTSNFHTHTRLCKHADGMPAEYAAQAAQDGCSALGFSDHCPYPADGINTWNYSRMDLPDAPGYLAAVRKAAQSAPFPVYAGFECEWAPRYESWYRDYLLAQLGADYLVFGPHWLLRGTAVIYAPDITRPSDIRDYFAQTIQGIETGLYSFLAHPDLLLAAGMEWSAQLAALFSDLIDAAMAKNMCLEINGYGLIKPRVHVGGRSRYPYPVDEFWDLARQKNARIICNSDAHTPGYVIQGALNARRYAARLGLTPETWPATGILRVQRDSNPLPTA